MSQPRFEPGTSRIQGRSVTACVNWSGLISLYGNTTICNTNKDPQSDSKALKLMDINQYKCLRYRNGIPHRLTYLIITQCQVTSANYASIDLISLKPAIDSHITSRLLKRATQTCAPLTFSCCKTYETVNGF
jgi:hypothetical protein